MIIFFHSFYFIVKFLSKYYRRQAVLHDFLQNLKQCQELSSKEEASINDESNLESLAVLKFDPPVYVQRYCDVQELLLDARWGSEMAKIVEFGCAELKLFTYLKRLLYVKEILHVDIDEELLKDSLFRIEPLTMDHLTQRSSPLLVQVLAGSVSDPDYRLRGADAVIAIELIEHLYPDTLEALPYNIFSFIRPKIVIFTTPNADFNVLFPDFSGMRHHDHKFEWTRAQFQDWCEHITNRFPQYSVTFHGCGSGPEGSERFGHCSQMAVFTKEYERVDSEVPNECCNVAMSKQVAVIPQLDSSSGVCTFYSYSKVLEQLSASTLSIIGSVTNAIEDETHEVAETPNFYRLIHKIDYPYYPDSRTPNEIKLDEAKYKIYHARIYRYRYYVENLHRLEIPVYDLIYNNTGQFSTVTEMSKLLSDEGLTLEQCMCDGSGQAAVCVIVPLDMDSSRRTSVSELSDPPAATSDDELQQLQHWQQMLPQLDGSEEEERWDAHDEITTTTALGAEDAKDDPSTRLHLGAITATLTSTVDSKPSPGQNSDQLIDSGYQKSITSTAEWSPQSPLQDGMFEEQFNSCCALPQPSPEEIDDLDDKSPTVVQKKLITVVVGKETVGVTCTTPPGTSATNGKKIKKDTKESTGTRKKSRSKVHDLVEEDVRDLTQCLILNSLNRLPLEEPLQQEQPVQEEKPQEEMVVEEINEAFPMIGEEELAHFGALLEPLQVEILGVVENGDLANNNRDLEGNNYPDVLQEDIRRDLHEFEDNLNENIENNVDAALAIGFPILPHHDNLQEQLELANHNQDVANRNNVQNMPELQQLLMIPAVLVVDHVAVHIEEDEEINAVDQQQRGIRLPPPAPPSSLSAIEPPHLLHPHESMDPPELAEVHRASREALFDSDSQIDLLDEDMRRIQDGAVHEVGEDNHGQMATNIVLIGVNNYDEGMEDPFPHWLLQLLGDDGEQHDEPHFYCQGDGVGVHPSIVEVDIEDDEPSTSSSSADTSSAEDATATNPAVALAPTMDTDMIIGQPNSLPGSSAATLNDLQMERLEVIGLSLHPQLRLDGAVGFGEITTATNLLDLNVTNTSDRTDSTEELYFDTTEDMPVLPLVEVVMHRSEQDVPAAEVVVGGSFGCFDLSATSSSSQQEYKYEE